MIKVKTTITGGLDDLPKVFEALDGDRGVVSFDPSDPASIEQAIRSVEATIDERLAPFTANDFAVSLGNQMKQRYRDGIVAQAAAARLGKAVDNE
ncbi:conserved hypothetical protein [Hyphomicrobiales bacterium]|nr:conserved hypothetical protein [Hyphomicrobiales bacterium]CAH1693057.1 conserved hypothetical protein [Hyphomicrobiales bacterium]